jgi:hypothetical protein
LSGANGESEMDRVKTIPTNHYQPLEANPIFAGDTAGAGRFQILVEYAPGVFVSTVSVERIEDAVEFFLKQTPGCEAGEIALFDCHERRVIGSVKWTVEPTENGLRVPHRHNLFCDWNTALVALEAQRRADAERGSLVELIA